MTQERARSMQRDLNIIVKNPKKSKGDNMDNNKLPRTLKQDKKQVEDLIKSAMQDFLIRKSGLNLEKTKNLQNLVSLISEYLSAFVIIGYDVSGESVNLVHATNQMDADALSAAINKFLIHSTSSTPEGK